MLISTEILDMFENVSYTKFFAIMLAIGTTASLIALTIVWFVTRR